MPERIIPGGTKHQQEGTTSLYHDLAMLALIKRGGSPVKETIYEFTIKDRWLVIINGWPENRMFVRIALFPAQRVLPPYSVSVYCDGLYVGGCTNSNTYFLEEKVPGKKDISFNVENFERIVQDEITASGRPYFRMQTS